MAKISTFQKEIFSAFFGGYFLFAALNKLGEKVPLFSLTLSICLGIVAFTALFAFSMLTKQKEYKTLPSEIAIAVSFLVLLFAFIGGNANFYNYIGAILASLAVGAYLIPAFMSYKRIGLPSFIYYIAVGLASAFFIYHVGYLTACRYLSYRAPSYDFGIFAQALYSLKEHLEPLTTLERGYTLSHFSVHLSPILYLFLPFYCIFETPLLLQYGQAVVLASGAIPMFLIAKRRSSTKTAALFAILYTFYPIMSGGCFYDFHENCFLAPLILWVFYFAEKDKLIPTMIFTLLTCTVKEDAAVYVAIIGIYLLFAHKDKYLGAAVTLLSLGYFLFACWYIDTYGLGIMAYRYNNFSDSLAGVVIEVFKNPTKLLSECFYADNTVGGDKVEKLAFLAYMTLPLGLTCFVTKKPTRFILLIPFILVNLMPDYVYQYQLGFQYGFGSGAILVYLAYINFRDMSPKAKESFACFALAASFLHAAAFMPSRESYRQNMTNEAEIIAAIDDALSYVPDDKDVTVSVSTFLAANISARDEIYLIEDKKDTDYVVVDLRWSEWDIYETIYKNRGYETVIKHDDIVCIMKAPEN